MEKSISVVVPVYKVEKYIKFCVDSILAQTFQDFEIILVDDASPDGSVELCQKFYGDNEKVKLIRHEENRGLGEARNTGMKHAVGKYIYFVDSDDFISPVTLEKFYYAAEKNNAQVVHSAGHYEFTQHGDEPPSKKNVQLIWENYSTEGFLKNDIAYRLEKHWKTYDTHSEAVFLFCRRDFLEENQIKFLPIISEDETFNFALFCTAERYYILHEAFYIYRLRNNSIMRTYDIERLSKGIQAMLLGASYIKSTLEKIPGIDNRDSLIENAMTTLFERYSNNHTFPFYVNEKNFAAVNKAAEKVLSPVFGEYAIFVKYFFNHSHLYRRQAELLFRGMQTLNSQYSSQTMAVFNRLELSNNKIVFVSYTGRGFGCNPKYIALEILRQNLPYDLVWLVKDMDTPMPAKIRKVKYGGINSIYELATAKVIITNTKNLLPFPGKKYGQFFIMTWHDTHGFKLIERDAEEKLSPGYVAESKANSAITDLMMVSTQDRYDEFRRAFWYNGEILKCGIPRNDIFFRHDEKFIAQIRQNLNVPPKNKIVMYAPTFRNDVADTKEACRFDTDKILDAFRKRFGGEWTLLMRFHPNVASAFSGISFGDNIINATNYPDMQELILVSDAVISDYSSVIYDFMFIGKKVFIYATDFDSYTKERGFKPLYFKLPYKINRNEEELLNDIETFDDAAIEPKVKSLLETLKPFDDGHASEKVVERIKAVIENPNPLTALNPML